MLGTWLIKWGCKRAAKRRNRNFTGQGSCLYDITYDRNLAADVWRPKDSGSQLLPTVFYVHGGGFVAGDKSDFDAYCEHLCAAGYTVINLNYTLSPAARHPQAVGEILRAVGFFVSQSQLYGVDPARLAVGGDSAGAFLAFAAGAAIANPEYLPEFQPEITFDRRALKGLLLFCGAFRLQTARRSGFPFIGEYIAAYAGTKDLDEYLASEAYRTADPLQHVSGGVPPVFLAVGSGDRFLDESKTLAVRLEEKGCDVTLYVEQDKKAGHEFHSYLETPAAGKCSEETFGFLDKHLRQQ